MGRPQIRQRKTGRTERAPPVPVLTLYFFLGVRRELLLTIFLFRGNVL